MSYENAPATQMLATHCAVCHRPLLDALSVEIGIGPVCRERHGYDAACAELGGDARDQANVITAAIARAVGTVDESPAMLDGVAKLRALGFVKLAERIEFRGKDRPVGVVAMRPSTRGTGWYVLAPFSPAAVDAWRAIPGRRWDGDSKENFVPTHSREALWQLLTIHYAGFSLNTDGTTVTIPAVGEPVKAAA